MDCKNCHITLRKDYSFCPNCGAKVVRNRITNKGLVYDVLERYFNLDNTFLKTLWYMLIKPESVCGGYISGLRKKYLNPVSMLAISLTLSGFVVFLMKKLAWSSIDFSKISYSKTSSGGFGTEKIMSSTMEYSSLLFLFYIPVIALASYLFFNKKNYNIAEHTVNAIYSLTTFSIISAVYAIIALFISPQFYINTAIIYSLIMIIFCIYIAYRNSLDAIKSLIWRIPMFIVVFMIGYIGVSLFTIGFLFLTGEISIQDFKPE